MGKETLSGRMVFIEIVKIIVWNSKIKIQLLCDMLRLPNQYATYITERIYLHQHFELMIRKE